MDAFFLNLNTVVKIKAFKVEPISTKTLEKFKVKTEKKLLIH